MASRNLTDVLRRLHAGPEGGEPTVKLSRETATAVDKYPALGKSRRVISDN